MAKTVGTGLYLEYRFSEGALHKTTQFIITQDAVSPISGDLVKARMYSRQIDTKNPQRGWKHRDTDVQNPGLDGMGGLLPKTREVAMADAFERMSNVISYINQMEAGQWTLYKMPLAIQLTGADIIDVEKAETPKALIRRINSARREAGFVKDFIGPVV